MPPLTRRVADCYCRPAMVWIVLLCLSAFRLRDTCPRLASDVGPQASWLPANWLLASKLTASWLLPGANVVCCPGTPANDVGPSASWLLADWLLASKSTASWLLPGANVVWLAVSEAGQHPSLVSMTFSYSISQLRRLNSEITPGYNIPIINELGLLRRPRYVHRSTRKKFVYHQQLDQRIPSIWTAVAQLTRHQSAVAPGVSSSENTETTARQRWKHRETTSHQAGQKTWSGSQPTPAPTESHHHHHPTKSQN